MLPKVNLQLNKELDQESGYVFFKRKMPIGGVNKKEMMIDVHPQLKTIKTKKQFFDYVDTFYKENLAELNKRKKEIQDCWNSINNKFFKISADMFNKKWTERKFEAFLSIFPNNPRSIEGKIFMLWYKMNDEECKRVIAHEIIHFKHFDICKKLLNNPIWSESKSNTLGWHLSEIQVTVFMKDSRLKKLFLAKIRGYPVHWDCVILFENIWKNSKYFEDFLLKSTREVKKCNFTNKDLSKEYFKVSGWKEEVFNSL